MSDLIATRYHLDLNDFHVYLAQNGWGLEEHEGGLAEHGMGLAEHGMGLAEHGTPIIITDTDEDEPMILFV